MSLSNYQDTNFVVGTATAVVVGAFILLLPLQAQATKKVYAPYVEMGEWELEYRGGYDFDDDGDKQGAWKQKIGLGYGIAEYWFSEIYGEFEKGGARGDPSDFTAIEWENRFQLTQRGEYWLDVGLLGEVKYNISGGADKGELKLLLAKDVGAFTHLANIILEREFGEDASKKTEGGLAWGSRYRYKPSFEPGFEIHSGFGALSDTGGYEAQSHRIGPTVYGKIGSFKYDVGYLVGVFDAAPDGTLKVLFEYEWDF